MQSTLHKEHILARMSHANCSECRADTERRFVDTTPFTYTYVHEYLAYVRPRLAAIRNDTVVASSVDARVWYRGFILALHRRISYKSALRISTGINIPVSSNVHAPVHSPTPVVTSTPIYIDDRRYSRSERIGRKWNGSYTERLRNISRNTGTDSLYLRRFASRGASALDY